jgi:tetratricopeptide (TPR) repeat protein
MTRARVLVALIGCSLLLAAPPPALAASDPAAGRAAFDEGQRQFLAGDYRAALAAFEKGYLLTDDAAFTLNIAQCHRYLGETKEALLMYRIYLKATPERGNREARAVATKAIRELEAEVAAAPAAPPGAVKPLADAAPAPVPAAASPPAPAPRPTRGGMPVFEPSAELETQHQAALPSARPSQVATTARRLRQAGIACGAVGVVALGVGVYYWTRATSLSDSANNAAVYNPSDYDSGKSAETMQWVFYGVGAAAVAAGAGLYAYGRWYARAQQPSVALAPVIGPGAVGLAAQGAF